MHTEFAHLPKVLRTILQTTRVLIAPEGAGRGFLMNHYRFFAVEVSTGNNVGGIVESVNADLPNYETIRKFVLLPTELSIESGELTPSLKVKRRVVMEKWGHLISELYAGE